MISIVESKPHKLSGLSSFTISFNYKKEYVDIVKSVNPSVYDKNSKSWEVPITALSSLIEAFARWDNIELTLLQDSVKSYPEHKLSSYKTKPFDYQLEAIQYGLNHDKWLLLDAPGLGKTLTMIDLAFELRKAGKIKHCLVICGVNTLKTNWKKEIQKHSNLSCRILGEKQTKAGKTYIGSVADRIEQLKKVIPEFFVITNIETLRNNDVIKALKTGKNKFDMIVMDEIHVCKDPASHQSRNLLKLDAPYKIGLTGTFLLNSPLDSYIPLKWIGAEKSAHSEFKYFYTYYTGTFGNEILMFKNIPVLQQMLDKYALRRTKDILNLPPKTVITEYVEMNSVQQLFYNSVKEGVVSNVDKVKLNTANILAMGTRLRQATALPAILTSDNIESSKVQRACDLAEQIVSSNEKVVIFSTFKDTCYELAKKLTKFNPVVCTGDYSDIANFQNIDTFQSDNNVKIMIATHQKMGVGITLTAASTVIFIDLPWTDANFCQACDRVYRIGTTKPVTIYCLTTVDTIDERVLEIVNDKSAISDYVLDGAITQSGIDSLKKYILELRDI